MKTLFNRLTAVELFLSSLIVFAVAPVYGLEKEPFVLIHGELSDSENAAYVNKWDSAVEETLSDMKQLGVTHLNGVSINEIERLQKKLAVRFVKSLTVKESESSVSERNGAAWNAQSKSILQSMDHWNQLRPEIQGPLGIHEITGMSQNGDWNHEKTAEYVAFSRYSKMRRDSRLSPTQSEKARLDLLKTRMQSRQGKGGVTGVGGGGDGHALFIKSEMILILLKMSERFQLTDKDFEAILVAIHLMNIEMSSAIPVGDFMVEAWKLIFNPNTTKTEFTPILDSKLENYLRHLILDWTGHE